MSAKKAGASAAAVAERAPESSALTAWLVSYNALQLLGWCYTLWLLYSHFTLRYRLAQPLYGPDLWALTEMPVKVLLTGALLEIVHALLGAVKANPATTALQVGARLTVLWLIVHFSPAAQSSPWLALCFTAWALVEPTRYSFYLVKQLGLTPVYAHTWLRYSLFLPLYPAGIVGEFGCLVTALLGDAAALQVAQPNAYNLVYSHRFVLALLALLYPSGSITMVGHMWRERGKQLGGEQQGKAKAG